jgi:hypothetical protein
MRNEFDDTAIATMLTRTQAEVCPLCEGTGWKTLPAKLGAPKDRRVTRCDCQLRVRNQNLLAAARIPKRYEHCELSTFFQKLRDNRTVLSSQFSVLSSQFSVLSSRFSVLGSRFSVLQFSVLSSRFSVLGSPFFVLSVARSEPDEPAKRTATTDKTNHDPPISSLFRRELRTENREPKTEN